MKAKTRSLLSVCLAVVLILSAVLGTIAYMTATDEVVNTFAIGSFTNPTTKPDGSDLDLNGYIWEESWTPNSKLVPGQSIDKDPRGGIGADSENSAVV